MSTTLEAEQSQLYHIDNWRWAGVPWLIRTDKRVMHPLLDAPPPVHRHHTGWWGPAAAEDRLAGFGTWRGPCLA